MRIVVVEDEPNTRDGLLRVINKSTGHSVVGIAQDGEEGLAKIEELRPDLIVSDIRMPRMDGLAMLQKLFDRGADFQAILLTGYSEFEYARRALQLEVVSYILKPLDVAEFLEALRKVERRVQRQEQEQVSVAQLVFSVLTSPKEEKGRFHAMLGERLPISERDKATLFLVRPGGMDTETATEMQFQMDHLLGSVYMGSHHVCLLPGGIGILAILPDSANNPIIRRVFRDRVLARLREIGPCLCSTGAICDIREMEQEVRNLDALLQHAFSFEPDDIIDRDMAASLRYDRLNYPEDLENCIRKEIRQGDTEKMRETANKFLGYVLHTNASPEQIREYTAKFATSILSAASEWSARAQGGERPGFHYLIQNIINSHSRDDLAEQFSRVLDTASTGPAYSSATDNSIVLKVIEFIRCNYRGNITLTDAADLVGITPEYLSKLFYQEMSVNFVAFLRNFRISMAKRLLLEGRDKISDIAFQVGFNDVKYFNKVFKSVCGISPSDYKKGTK